MCSEMARRYRQQLRAASAQRTHAAILSAARMELSRFRSGRMRIDDVARRARVSRRTVYAHFRDRDSLAEAALRERADALAERVGRWQPRSGDPAAIVDEVVAFHARTYREEHSLLETLLDRAPAGSGRAMLRELDATRLQVIARTMQALAARGALRVRPADATALLHATLAYPAWRVALTGPAGRRAPRLVAGALKAALLA
jgi:AcrR family transcriptional regulator